MIANTLLTLSLFAADTDLRSTLASILAQAPATGLLIFDVLPESHAQHAGLQVGDILTHYDGQPIASHAELSALARTANNDRRSEILILAVRAGRELEITLPAGPLGVRLEEVAKGDRRPLPNPAPTDPIDWRPLQQSLAQPSHRWQLIHLVDRDPPVGWSHEYRVIDRQRGPTVRQQQFWRVGDRPVRRDVTLSFDVVDTLPVRSLLLSIDDKPILDVRSAGSTLTGTRVGVPVEARQTPADFPYDLVGDLAQAMAITSRDAVDLHLLMPASLEPAPLCQCRRVSTADRTEFVVTKFGREEARIKLSPKGDVLSVRHRGGLVLAAATVEDIVTHFPDAKSLFPPIEQLPALRTAATLQAD
jgi:hypothetical protein